VPPEENKGPITQNVINNFFKNSAKPKTEAPPKILSKKKVELSKPKFACVADQ